MCGIIALIGKHKTDDIDEALQLLNHRGKEGTKIYRGDSISIGFNRLAINDESEKGIQPFEYGDLIGVFNGEIFNYKALAEENNISLSSNSDMEIVLPLYAKYGVEIIDYLDGFYSGLIYEISTRRLYTIRDYIGKKPLFYGVNSSFEFITSEIKGIKDVVSFDFVPKGISIVENKTISKIAEHKLTKNFSQDLKKIIIKAVKKRVPENKEIPFGVFLSGGLDSSILGTIVNNLKGNAIFYSLVNSDSDDFRFVQELSSFLDIKERLKIVELPTPNELDELINKLVYITESYNPSIISNGLATYLLSKTAFEDGLKIILSGEGADELFCGYKISRDILETKSKSEVLIDNLHYTELRRLDLASMSNTIEARCPFLDKEIYEASLSLTLGQLGDKQILRDLFINDLPKSILSRKKTSFDVGSGIRKLVVEHLKKYNALERDTLKEIWLKYYSKKIVEEKYFSKYPVFDEAIDKRGIKHK